MDASGYKISFQSTEAEEEDRFLSLQANEQERFADCEPLVFKLPGTDDETVTLNCGVFAETVRLDFKFNCRTGTYLFVKRNVQTVIQVRALLS